MCSGINTAIVLGNCIVGGNTESTEILKMFSIICGINLSRTGEGIYKHGFVLTYISQGLKWSSMMKSNPNSSKPNLELLGSILL